MPMSEYLRNLRAKVGNDIVVLPSAAAVIQDARGRVLFGLHADKNIWVVPGGMVEPGEIPADAAVRETWEETGLFIEVTGILGVYGGQSLIVHYDNGDVASYVGTIFRGRAIAGDLKPDGVEILELSYFSRAEIASRPHSAWMDSALDSFFAGRGEAGFQPSTWRPPGESL